MSEFSLATAVVRVLPDLTAFNEKLITDLRQSLAKVENSVVQIPVSLVVNAASIEALQAQINKLPPVQVNAILSQQSAATIRSQVESALRGIAVSPVSAPISTGAAGGVSGGGAVLPAGVSSADVSIAAQAAIGGQTSATQQGAAASRNAATAEKLLAFAKRDVAKYSADVAKLTQTETILKEASRNAERQLTAAITAGDVERIKEIGLLQKEIDDTLRLATVKRTSAEITALANQKAASGVLSVASAENQYRSAAQTVARAEQNLADARRFGTKATVDRARAALDASRVFASEKAQALDLARLTASSNKAIERELRAVQRAQDDLVANSQRTVLFNPETARRDEAELKKYLQLLDRRSNAIQKTARDGVVFQASTQQTIAALEAERASVLRNLEAFAFERKKLDEIGRSRSQFNRGLVGTSAGFLGLRGAVLAASGPFLAATIGLTALGKVVSSASELQGSLRTFQATTGASAETMQQASDYAIQLGGDLSLPATSATDAAVAMTELAKAGLSIKDSFGATRGVLQLAVAGNLSVSDAATIAASQLNAFGLAGDQAARVTNLLAGASIAAQGDIKDFAVAYQQSSAAAKQAGVSIEQTNALLTELARAGIRGSDAGTSLRVMLLRLVPSTKEAQKAFQELGIRIDESKTIGEQLPSIIDQFTNSLKRLDPQAQTDVIRRIFGQDASRAATITLTQGAQAFQSLIAQTSKAGNAQALTEARAKGLSGAVDNLSSTISTLSTEIGQMFIPSLTAVVRGFTRIAQSATDAAKAMKPTADVINSLGMGMGDTIAQFALLALGFAGIQKLVIRLLRYFELIPKVATTAAEQQIAAQQAIGAAVAKTNFIYDAQGNKIALNGEKAAAAAAGGGLLARGKKFLGGPGGGLALGLGLTLAGDQIGGTAGGVLSGAATGAIAGSFVPIPGATVAGAIIGGGAGYFQQQAQKDQAKLEQQTQDALAKYNSLTEDGKSALIMRLMQMPNIPGGSFGKMAFIRTFGQDGILKYLWTTGKLQAPVGKASNVTFKFPSIGLRSPQRFDYSKGRVVSNDFSQMDIFGGLTNKLTGGAVSQPRVTSNQIAALNQEISKSAFDYGSQEKVLSASIARLRNEQVKILGNLDLFKSTPAEWNRAIKNFQKTQQQILDFQNQLNDLYSNDAASQKVALQQLNATATKSLNDDIAANNEFIALARKRIASGKLNAQQIADINYKIRQTEINNQNLRQQQADDAAQAAQDAANEALANAARAARLANYQGAAQKKYIELLQKQVDEAKKNGKGVADALDALDAARNQAQEYQQSIVEARFSVRETRLNNILQRARNNENESLEASANKQLAKLMQKEINAKIALLPTVRGNALETLKLKNEIEVLRGKKESYWNTVKELLNGDKKKSDEIKFGSFQAAQLVQNLLTGSFASNIALEGFMNATYASSSVISPNINLPGPSSINNGPGVTPGDSEIVRAVDRVNDTLKDRRTVQRVGPGTVYADSMTMSVTREALYKQNSRNSDADGS